MQSNGLVLAMTPALLLGARVSGLILIIPAFSSRTLPRAIKVALTGVLTLLVMGSGALTVASARLDFGTILTEMLVGFSLGFGGAVLIGAAEMAGTILSVQMGLSGAQTLNPSTGEGLPTVGHVMAMAITTLFLVSGAHLLVLEALVASTRLIPVGGPVDVMAGIPHLIATGAVLFELGMRLASPVVAALLVGNVLLGALGRTVPQLNVLMMAFPLQIGIGLVLLGFSFPLLAVLFQTWLGMESGSLQTLIGAFSPTMDGGR